MTDEITKTNNIEPEQTPPPPSPVKIPIDPPVQKPDAPLKPETIEEVAPEPSELKPATDSEITTPLAETPETEKPAKEEEIKIEPVISPPPEPKTLEPETSEPEPPLTDQEKTVLEPTKEETIKEGKEKADQPPLKTSAFPSPAPLPQEPQPTPIQVKQPIVCPAQPKVDFEKLYKNKLMDGLRLANKQRKKIKQKNLDAIMSYVLEKQKITNDDVERITGVKDRTALKYLKILVKQGKLIRFGNKRNAFYKPIKK